MKQCFRCEKILSLESFSWRNKAKGTLHSWCKSCRKEYDAALWKNGTKKKTSKEARQKTRGRLEEYLVAFWKTHPCVDCGETNIVKLDFDHLRDKEDNIARMIANDCSINKISKEIEKCEVVCKNCHAVRTANRGQNWRLKYI
jgi:hypothetical protein